MAQTPEIITDEMLELDKKRAAYWRQRANDLFEVMKIQIQKDLGEPFEKAVLNHRDRFTAFGVRWMFTDFTERHNLMQSLTEYDKSMIRVKKSQIELPPEQPVIVG